MSAVFHLLYHGQHVRLVNIAGKSVYELVPRGRATPFTSRVEAWAEAVRHHMVPEQVQIEDAHKPSKEAA